MNNHTSETSKNQQPQLSSNKIGWSNQQHRASRNLEAYLISTLTNVSTCLMIQTVNSQKDKNALKIAINSSLVKLIRLDLGHDFYSRP